MRTLAGAMNALTSDAVRMGKPQDLVLDPMENALAVPGRENETVSLGEIAHMARLEGGSVDASGMTRVRFFPNGSNTGISLVVATPSGRSRTARRDARSLIGMVSVKGAGSESRGFTLIEIAVAWRPRRWHRHGAAGLRRLGAARPRRREKSEAVMHAKALMDSVLWAPELVADVSHGEIGDGFRWDRTIREAGPDDGIGDR